MPQGNYFVAKNANNVLVPMRTDAQGTLLSTSGGTSSRLNIAAATVVKATPGRVCQVSVVTAGSTLGTINDVATTGAAAAANQVGSAPNTAGAVVPLNFPCAVGIVVVPGTGQVLAVSYI